MAKKRYRRKGKMLSGHALHRQLYPHQKILIPVFTLCCIFLFGLSFNSDLTPLRYIALPFVLVLAILVFQFFRTRNFLHSFRTVEELRTMNPFEFEHYTVGLLRKLGFEANTTSARRDFGVDFIAKRKGVRYAGQCKRYSPQNTVTSEQMQQFLGSMQIYKAQKGIYVTTSRFTKDAQKIAKHHSIELVDQDRLCSMIQKAYGK